MGNNYYKLSVPVSCRACLLTALGTSRRCPTCRTAAGGRRDAAVATLVVRARMAAEMVDELVVHCPHGAEQVGEEWRVKAGACGKVVARGGLAQHLLACEWAEVGCRGGKH